MRQVGIRGLFCNIAFVLASACHKINPSADISLQICGYNDMNQLMRQ